MTPPGATPARAPAAPAGSVPDPPPGAHAEAPANRSPHAPGATGTPPVPGAAGTPHAPDAAGTPHASGAAGTPHASGAAGTLAAIRAALAGDARVAAVTLQAGAAGPVARVTASPAWLRTERERAHAALRRQLLRQWEMIYDGTYHAGAAPHPPGLEGWTSSFTGAPIPPASMRVWLDATLARLRALPHARVLDIGCGAGLVLAELAPDCTSYLGIDLSEEAIRTLAAWTATQPALRHVRLAHGPAHELDAVAPGSVDLVVLNSVAQYFPDLEYLLLVLRAACRCLAPGGRIVLGDLRALHLLPVQAAAVALARAAARTPAAPPPAAPPGAAPPGAPQPDAPPSPGELRAQAEAALLRGRELALDPGLFATLAAPLPRLSDVRFGLKPAGTDPELAGYRYDATLVFDAAPPCLRPPPLAWQDPADGAPADTQAVRSLAELQALLARQAPDALALLGVPNARLAPDAARAARLWTQPAVPPRARPATAGIEPEALAEAAAALGYATELRLAPGAADGRFDALLCRTEAGLVPGDLAWPAAAIQGPWANDPLGAELLLGLSRTLQHVVDAAPGGPCGVRILLEG